MPEKEPFDILAAVQSLFPEDTIEENGIWLRVWMDRLDPALRSGWKLHLSSVPAEMPALIDWALPVLQSFGIPFKILRTQEHLEEMNEGYYGLMQVGKAVTIYPPDEASAVAVAEAMRTALRGLAGPRIPSDSRYCAEAPVYFRYGPFDGRFVIDAMGQRRRILWHPGHGEVVDPASGGDTPPPKPTHLPAAEPYDHVAFLRGRYLFVRVLQVTAKGGAFAAVECGDAPKSLLFIKTAKSGTNSDCFGRDAIWGLRREHHLLEDLAEVPGVPPPGELLEDANDVAALVRPYIEGETLWELWTAPNARTREGRGRLQRTLASVAELIERVHARGVIIRDLSPGNILLAGDAAYVLDLELGHTMGIDEPAYRRGTLGFYDPLLDRFRAPSPREDHYGLLALALMAHAGIHPAWLSRGLHEWAQRQTAPATGSAFQRAWRNAYETDAFPEAFGEVLEHVAEAPARSQVPPKATDMLLQEFRTHLHERIAACSEQAVDSDELTVYSGLAGLILVGMEWNPHTAFGGASRECWQTLCGRLAAAARDVAHIPGLYFGATGIGLALVALGAWLEDAALLDSGRDVLLDGVETKSKVPDVCQGLAGYALGLLAAGVIAGEEPFTAKAIEAGQGLAAMAETADEGGAVWPWPEGPYGSLSGARLYGFAHGVAGIAYTLFRLYAATGERAFLEAAEAGLVTLRAASRPVDGTEDARWWPCSREDGSAWNAWCHGTPGVLKAFAAGLHVRAQEADRRLLMQGVRGIMAANNGNYCLCHGVASRLDAYEDARALFPAQKGAPDRGFLRALADEAERDAALLGSLDLFVLEQAQRRGGAGSEAGGLMTGAAGAVRTLLRHGHGLSGPYGQTLP